MNLDCSNKDLFTDLTDQKFFCAFVEYQYGISSKQGALIPEISPYSCDQAYKRFVSDRDRIAASEFGKNGELDHFKQTSLLVFWLRRFSPIHRVLAALPEQSLIKVKSRVPAEERVKVEEREYAYLNQQITFDIGFRILCFWEAMRSDSAEIYGKTVSPSEFKLASGSAPNQNFLSDLYYVFSDKSLSPHAIWAIYKSLFHQLLK